MPTNTFLKLSEEKKNKILKAAKKEFSRVSIDKASIQNIVENAGIARGSFYQYFENKEDLLEYLLKEHSLKLNNVIEKNIKCSNGDIFEFFIGMYEFLSKKSTDKDEDMIIRHIFENMKTMEDSYFTKIIKNTKPKSIEEYYYLIDINKYKIKNKEEFMILIKMLHSITISSIACSFKYGSIKKAKKDYLKQIEFLKYGILNKESEN